MKNFNWCLFLLNIFIPWLTTSNWHYKYRRTLFTVVQPSPQSVLKVFHDLTTPIIVNSHPSFPHDTLKPRQSPNTISISIICLFQIFNASYKWNHTVYNYWFLSLTIVFKFVLLLLNYIVLLQTQVTLYRYTYLSADRPLGCFYFEL